MGWKNRTKVDSKPSEQGEMVAGERLSSDETMNALVSMMMMKMTTTTMTTKADNSVM